MSGEPDGADETKWLRWRGVAELYHAYFTGLILSVVTRRGHRRCRRNSCSGFSPSAAGRFLPAWKKLGLSICRRRGGGAISLSLHWIGGVHVEYMHETDRRPGSAYPPARWICGGTAICGVPRVSRAMLRGWHANNGVSLGNPNLGFVIVPAERRRPGRARGYYCEYDHAHRNRSTPGVRASSRSALVRSRQGAGFAVASWPKPRLEKAYRNYAMEYVRTAAAGHGAMFGPKMPAISCI